MTFVLVLNEQELQHLTRNLERVFQYLPKIASVWWILLDLNVLLQASSVATHKYYCQRRRVFNLRPCDVLKWVFL